ncbi:hypothetical protein B9G53_08185 [Pseudanabaena sp. SR411]|uniref:tetratricopeptide repeat protein n=1 Tax=Pseudanabaena sp. SR411 TaxID=1980935 RepID=UPI000B983C2A|nr:tetratricopeptide repeat protein [Pseudanabaena sp. SR411]OYQ65229.1 hypothetical protein B9G53_08185 [Pseudanabaena sp. SR411]
MIFWTKRLVWHSLFNQGLCYIEILELDEAFRAFQYLHQEILTIAEHGNYVENGRFQNEVMSNIVSTLALICSKIGMSDEAISLADLCYGTVLMPSYDSWTQGYSRLFLGMAYQTLGDSRKSEFMFNNAIKYARESNYRQVEGKAINGLAEMYRQKKDFQNAVLSHLSSIEILNKIGAVCDLAEAYLQLGLTYQAMGEHDQAEEYKAKALELFAQMEAPKQIERVNKAFGENIQ